MYDISNQEIIDKYLNRYIHSKQSISTRRSCLNYFFNTKYFGYSGHIFDIKKKILLDYFNYLNQLKNLSLGTKKTKWILLKSFLDYCSEYYEDDYGFIIRFPKNSIKWKPTHKEPNTNKNVVMNIEELKKILNWLRVHHFSYYLIFRVLAETGMRKGGLIAIDYDKIFLKERYIETNEKNGRNSYFISRELSNLLEIYLERRKSHNIEEKALFISNHLKRLNIRTLNQFLKGSSNRKRKGILKTIGIKKNITCHTFRKTLNTLRYEMGCPDGDLEFLLCHAISINRDKYIKLTHEQKLELYDKWYPYHNISI